MMKTKTFAAIALCSMAAFLGAQSDLTVGGTLTSGGTVIFSVTGAPASSPTAVLVSTSAGQTTVGLGLTIDLAAPFLPIAIASTDATGALSVTLNIPTVPASLSQTLNLNAQAVTVDLSGFTVPTLPGAGGPGSGGFQIPTFTFVKSDVEAFALSL